MNVESFVDGLIATADAEGRSADGSVARRKAQQSTDNLKAKIAEAIAPGSGEIVKNIEGAKGHGVGSKPMEPATFNKLEAGIMDMVKGIIDKENISVPEDDDELFDLLNGR